MYACRSKKAAAQQKLVYSLGYNLQSSAFRIFFKARDASQAQLHK